jgi:hypothetical protein
VAGVTTTSVDAGGWPGVSVGDDPQPDRVSTTANRIITRRLLIQLECISLTSVEGEIEGTSRALQWTRCQLFFNSSSTGNALC